jgi:hypothetical protein
LADAAGSKLLMHRVGLDVLVKVAHDAVVQLQPFGTTGVNNVMSLFGLHRRLRGGQVTAHSSGGRWEQS